MDQGIFEQLDTLQRRARNLSHPRRDEYNNNSVEYSGYESYETRQDDYAGHAGLYESPEYEFVDNSPVVDSFDEQSLRRPDHDSGHGQAALGRARPSLMPGRRHAPVARDHQVSPKIDFSRIALDPGPVPLSTSSPLNSTLPSSPAYKNSQRRQSEWDIVRDTRELRTQPFPATEQPAIYQPLTVDGLEEEGRKLHASEVALNSLFQPSNTTQPHSRSKHAKVGPLVVQGIHLISTQELPDRFRAIFLFPLFNAVQSKSFETIYNTDNNFVLSAPTGSGKTAVLELAICRLMNGFTNGSFKVVYQAPTKSLCSERQRDWQAKFGPLDLQCAELTGDTDFAQLRNVQHASIIITTPEKWDSMTRKWKDHLKLMQMVRLFLIDEVHILKDDRGATLEAVVSRMKSVGSNVRFVALSATVPNSHDIAAWLGKDPMNPHRPALRERFGEEFRPVRLRKHVCGYQSNTNDFAFEKTLNARLPDIIARWSEGKPIMVFCFTRNACVETAKLLADWWETKGPEERYWSPVHRRITVADRDLNYTISSGVAFHHAGLSTPDRTAVEKGYLRGDINVICCTSTLAVGVNLPCHMVIIKNTVSYQGNATGGCKEYSDLEIMQMLGRAGRPQFDDNAVAVIMTRLQRVPYYEKMISGQEVLESCLHRNLIDHLNAEIGLGTVTSASSAKKWLSSTFLYVRLKENHEHYKLESDGQGRNLDERLESICNNGIALLKEHDLVRGTPELQCTEFGNAMARYYIQFDTMKIFLALPPKAKVSEILSAIAQAAEFRDVRFRAGEKNTYKDLNKHNCIKFPIPVNLDGPAHKVSLIIQAVLGAVDHPMEDYKHRQEFAAAKNAIFQRVHRFIRCIIDCQLYLEDAVTTRNALMLARSLGAQVWDDSPLHMKQLEGIGHVYVRKLAAAGMKSIEDLENAEAHRIEMTLSRQPPFGAKLQEKAKAFPKLRVCLQRVGEPGIKKGQHVTVKIKAEIGFLNEKVPEAFQGKAVYVCTLAETSDGHMLHFARISAKKLNKGQDLLFSAELMSPAQTIRAYVMCDEIAGTMRHAVLKPEIPPNAFPPPKSSHDMEQDRSAVAQAPNTSKRRTSARRTIPFGDETSDEFGDAGIEDADLALAEASGFVSIEDIDVSGNSSARPKQKKQTVAAHRQIHNAWEPHQLVNGKWACNHACKDKTACKHLCCRDGLDKKPKPPKPKEPKKSDGHDPRQTQLSMPIAKTAVSPTAAASSMAKSHGHAVPKVDKSHEVRELNRLHHSVKKLTPKVPTLGHTQLGSTQTGRGKPRLSFLEAARSVEEDAVSTDYGVNGWDSPDLPSLDDLDAKQTTFRMSLPLNDPPYSAGEEDMLDNVIGDDAGFENSHHLSGRGGNILVDLFSHADDCDAKREEDRPFTSKEHHGLDASTSTPQPILKDILPQEGMSESLSGTRGAALDFARQAAQDARGYKRLPDTVDDLGAGPGELFNATKRRKSTHRTRSTPLTQDLEQAMQPAMEKAFPTEIVNVDEANTNTEQHLSSDELEKWFKAEFGTDQFNYTR